MAVGPQQVPSLPPPMPLLRRGPCLRKQHREEMEEDCVAGKMDRRLPSEGASKSIHNLC